MNENIKKLFCFIDDFCNAIDKNLAKKLLPSGKNLGSVNKILSEPYEGHNEVQKAHKNLSNLVKSGKNPSEIFATKKKHSIKCRSL